MINSFKYIYKKKVTIVKGVAGLIFLFTVFVFIIQTIEIITSNLETRIDSIGIQNLLIHYNLTIQLSIALIAIFTILICLKRITLTERRLIQTENELKLLNQNNRFNTYIKHREEFYAHFQGENLIEILSEKAEISNRSMLRHLHKNFYAPTYEGFGNKINQRSLKFGDQLNYFIRKTGLNETVIDLEKFNKSKTHKSNFIKGYKFQEMYLTGTILSNHHRQHGKSTLNIEYHKLDYFENIIRDIANIQLLYEIYNAIGEFEGEIFARDPKQFKNLELNNIHKNIQNYQFINNT